MSLPATEYQLDADNVSIESVGFESIHPDVERTTTGANVNGVSKAYETRQYLAPPHGPVRPLSPDTISNLSVEEFEQLHSIQSPKQDEPYDPSWRGKLRAFKNRNLGLFYILLAQIFGCMMNVTTRFLEVEGNKGKGLQPIQILFARMSITALLAMIYMWYNKTPYFPFGMPEVRRLLVARGLGGFFGIYGMYYTLVYLPLADATVITFLAPGLTCWVCSHLLKERFTRTDRIGTLVSFVGVIFIARPTSFFHLSSTAPPASGNGDALPIATNSSAHLPDASDYGQVTPGQRIAAVGMALVGVFGSVCAYTTIRWIGKRAHPLISVNYFAVWCTLVSTVAQLTLPGVGFLLPADLKEWGLLLFLGSCGFTMQFLLAAGLSYEKSSRATNMTYTGMLFALSFDKFFFGVTPSIMSIIGSSLILGGAIFMAMQKAETVKEQSLREQGQQEEEAGLIGLAEGEEAHRLELIPPEEVQLRSLR